MSSNNIKVSQLVYPDFDGPKLMYSGGVPVRDLPVLAVGAVSQADRHPSPLYALCPMVRLASTAANGPFPMI